MTAAIASSAKVTPTFGSAMFTENKRAMYLLKLASVSSGTRKLPKTWYVESVRGRHPVHATARLEDRLVVLRAAYQHPLRMFSRDARLSGRRLGPAWLLLPNHLSASFRPSNTGLSGEAPCEASPRPLQPIVGPPYPIPLLSAQMKPHDARRLKAVRTACSRPQRSKRARVSAEARSRPGSISREFVGRMTRTVK